MVILQLLKNFSKIDINRTTADTSAATYAKRLIIAVDGVAELVHDPLAETMLLDGSRVVSAGVQGEQAKHA